MKNEGLNISNSFPVPGLIGLVACGGKSSRMGSDKSMFNYNQKPQRYHLYDILKPFCEQVFISCNELQLEDINKGYRFLVDMPAWQNTGPMAALLTAFSNYPENNFMLIGCDYPFIDADEITLFLKNWKSGKTTVFYNEKEDMYEPLLAFYHNSIKECLMEMAQKNQHSLQELLLRTNAGKYYPANKKTIIGINTMEELMEACKLHGLLKSESKI